MKLSFSTVLVVGSLAAAALSGDIARAAERREQPPVRLDVSPRKALAGTALRVFVHVPTDPQNRRLKVTVDSGAFARTSEIDLEGERAPEAHWFELKALPAGEYVVEAVVYGATGPRTLVRASFVRE